MNARTLSDASGLSAEDLELLTYLLEDEGVEITSQQTIFPRQQDDRLPLSFAQTRLWFLDQLEPGMTAYNIPFALRIAGRLDLAALRRSLSEIVRRHEALRTTFPSVEGQPVQVIGPARPLDLPMLDLSALPPALHDAQIARHATRAAQQNFDLARGPLMIARLVRLDPGDHVVLLNVHHIVFDGWSVGMFLQEAMALYDAFESGKPSPLPDLPIQYADFALWQRDWLQGDVLDQQLAYWREQLRPDENGRLPLLTLPTDRPRPPRQTYRGAHVVRTLPAAMAQDLAALSQGEGSTLFMTLLAAFNVLLWRYSGQEDMIVGSPIANRDFVEIERLLGFFVNTLLLRTDLSGAPTFRDLMRRVREMTLAAYAHQNIPFEHLVDELQPQRDLSYHPLFQVMFVLQNAPLPSYERPGLNMRVLRVESGSSKFDLMLSMAENAGALTMVLEYNSALFDRPTVQRLLGQFETLLRAIVAAPDRPIGRLPLLGSAERQQILVEWNDNARPVPTRRPQERFADQAARTPDAVALVFDPDPAAEQAAASGEVALVAQLTYGALDRRANQLAHMLVARGVGPEERVGLLLDRSIELIVGVLGVLKAGSAYVPLDPAYPPERIAFMRDDSQVRVVVTKDEGRTTNAGVRRQESGVRSRELAADRAGGAAGGDEQRAAQDAGRAANDEGADSSRLDLSAEWPALAQLPDACPQAAPDLANLAYVIYTSGSTGSPKGVMISQRSVSNFITSTTALFRVTPRDRVLQFASICFDVSVFEVFTALLNGAALCLTARDTLLAPPALTALMQRQRLTLMDMAPAVMALLPGEAFPDLRAAFVGGEAFSGELVNRWRRAGRHFINGYGPTEATVTMTGYLCSGAYDRPPPIGRPLPNHQMYLLDQRLEPTPIGVAGELCIGGVGLARGYLGRPDLTAAAFVPNPFAQGSRVRDQGSDPDPRPLIPDPRLYRTGDLARALPDGNIEFLGRRDQQIKIRGFRIELGEIEAALGRHPAVRECAVLAHELAPGDARLAAYVVTSDEFGGTSSERPGDSSDASLIARHSSLAAELRAFLSERLPEHMIPSALVLLDALPLTQSGKLDRRALPAPDWSQRLAGQEYIAPRTPVERQTAEAIAEMLHVERVGLNDNFFALGGHSLLATRLTMRLSELFEVKLPLRSLFESPTVADLTDRIETLRWLSQDGQPPDEPLAEGHERGEI